MIQGKVMEKAIKPSRLGGIIASAFLLAAYSLMPVPEAQAAQLKRVPTEKVCMINNEFMGKKQFPVEVGGKTYYGCCKACYTALKTDAATRYAVDPVSGNKVDKALAVIGALPDGTVLYFESDKTYEAYHVPN